MYHHVHTSEPQTQNCGEVSLTTAQVAFAMITFCSAIAEGVAPLRNISHVGVGALFSSGVVAFGASMAAMTVISAAGAVTSSMLSVIQVRCHAWCGCADISGHRDGGSRCAVPGFGGHGG